MAIGFTGFTVKIVNNIGFFADVSHDVVSYQSNYVVVHASAQN
jgi:hypothetical protein